MNVRFAVTWLAACLALSVVSYLFVDGFAGSWDRHRVLVAVVFVTCVPGLGWAGAARFEDAAMTVAFAVGLSLASTALVAVAITMGDVGSWTEGIAVLGSMGCAGAIAWLVRVWHDLPSWDDEW